MNQSRVENLVARIRQLTSAQLDILERSVSRLESSDSKSEFDQSVSTSSTEQLAAVVSQRSNGWQESHASWPHAPLHRISEQGTYIVTAGTYQKQHWFAGPERLDVLQSTLLQKAADFSWQLEAWAVFSNHYHFVAHACVGAAKLHSLIKHIHAASAQEVNLLDSASDRQVWHNYWDTKLTFEKSYFARLNYVHQNAVKHRLVPAANQYRWCSARWFERVATPARVKTIYSFKTDRLNVNDDFEPI